MRSLHRIWLSSPLSLASALRGGRAAATTQGHSRLWAARFHARRARSLGAGQLFGLHALRSGTRRDRPRGRSTPTSGAELPAAATVGVVSSVRVARARERRAADRPRPDVQGRGQEFPDAAERDLRPPAGRRPRPCAAGRGARPVKVARTADGQRDVVIAIDAGHGGEDPGAIGKSGTREKNGCARDRDASSPTGSMPNPACARC